ncbi:hypothetical protein [Acinetobacter sp. YH01022]|uniref:hypothetical protein n=1 Tax=Acinetobacter sp. YH01022 TaxID=2601036 RepID=UPI0015D386BC|nr:hypothetical protein [Acinetobacter sp. YH01022]
MGTTFEFNQEFGAAKEVCCKNLNKLHLSVHPNFYGIHFCYQEVLKSIKADLSIFVSHPELRVWRDPNITGYTVANNFHLYLYWSNTIPQNIKLLVHSFPQDVEKIDLLKQQTSSEFLKFLSSFHHDLKKMNPERLQTLINSSLSPKAMLDLNKENSFKPHCSMSLDLLAQLLSCTRNQLNHRNNIIKQQRRNVLNQLEQTSGIVQQLLNNADFVLSPDQLWKS